MSSVRGGRHEQGGQRPREAQLCGSSHVRQATAVCMVAAAVEEQPNDKPYEAPAAEVIDTSGGPAETAATIVPTGS